MAVMLMTAGCMQIDPQWSEGQVTMPAREGPSSGVLIVIPLPSPPLQSLVSSLEIPFSALCPQSQSYLLWPQ